MRKLIFLAFLCLSIVGFGAIGLADGDRVLRVSFSWPTYIDPAVGSDYSSSASFVNLYDTLVYPDVDGSPLPHVARSWETSEDGLVWTFHLRDDVLFHDGTPLTAEDVKFSMDRITTIGEGYGFLFVGRVQKTEVVDDYTVRFHLSQPFGPFLTTLYRLYILNKDLVEANIKRPGPYGDMGDYGKEFLLTHDAGSGPYMVKEFRVEEELVMVKNPNYWLPLDPETPDEVRFIGTTEPATIRTMMARRELEISDQWQPQEAWQALDAIEGVDIASFYAGTEFYLMINTKKPPTDDVHFRRAMAWAMDYQTVVDHIFPGSIQARGPIPQNIPGADPNVFQFQRDLDKAREELKKSKYYDQLDQLEVEFHWIAEVPDEEKVALLFMANMAEIGINVKVVKVPWMSVVEEMAQLETSPHIVSVFDSSHYPEAGSLLESRYHSSSAPTWEQNEWLLDPTLDAMIEDALATVDRKERFAKYAEIQEYIVDLCPTIFLFEQVEKHAYQSAYVDWPTARGEVNPVMGYNMAARFIKVYPEKRQELLGG
ncbi:MAG: D,D-dipeptide ABC transport system substrate binding protein DdpA [Acetothermia bacterium 64_32]|nr:MAG: D,D-dipeptide ABC transport system substrate binding protein DdpA [Acetothermia bacterium 64_32]HAF70729.1 ABC transporter substrate-binding protein [Candidatus Acetothermia bacterium]